MRLHYFVRSQVKRPNVEGYLSTPVQFANDILLLAADCDLVGIDEAQFFDAGLVDICVKLANQGKRVIVAGLDMDYRGRPFAPIPDLLAISEYVSKQLAICVRCGNPAVHTQRLTAATDKIVVGAGGTYEARCRRCFESPPNTAEEESAG